MVGGEKFAGDGLEFFGGEGIDAMVEGFDVSFIPMMQITPAEVEGKLFAVVTGDGQLSFELALSSDELLLTEGLLHQTVQFMTYQTATTVDIMVIAAEIDAPDACITIGRHRTLNRIDQSVTLP